MKNLIEEYKDRVHFVYKPFALGGHSLPQIEAMYVAKEQGKFEEMLDHQMAKMETRGLPLDQIRGIATDIGMDVSTLNSRLRAQLYRQVVMTFCTFLGCKAPTDSVHQGIQPYEANPFYWEFKGEPVLLVGGSIEDNLFQRTDLEAQLNLLQGAGGNYVRNTMSSRDSGNEWPYEKNEAGLYDLNTFNTAYWDRFSRFLAQTATRGIIVQIEVWATFDYYDDHDRAFFEAPILSECAVLRSFFERFFIDPKISF